MRFVPDVVQQFAELAVRGEGLGFSLRGDVPEPDQCRHLQGMARWHEDGEAPYLFVTKSGNRPDNLVCDLRDCTDEFPACTVGDDVGSLLVVRMGSRDSHGERMRSNRLVRGSNVNEGTPPDARDANVATFHFEAPWPAYTHPGGVQLVGDVLVVPLEAPVNDDDPDNLIAFIDVSAPLQPTLYATFVPPAGVHAGLVGITPVRTETGRCCRYLMLVTGGENTRVDVFLSDPTSDGDATTVDEVTDLRHSSLSWQHVDRRSEDQIESCLSVATTSGPRRVDWHTGSGDAHQVLNFVRQGDVDGPLFLIGGRNTTPLPSGDDKLDLYRWHLNALGNAQRCLFTYVDTKDVTSHPIIGGGDSGNLAAAGGVYVSPSGELIVYSTEYENDGPYQTNPDGSRRRSVRFIELRHRWIVRPGSPTLSPSIHVNTPLIVPEGGSATLDGEGRPAITRAWLQLFEDDDLGASAPGDADSDDWLVAEFDDYFKDDFGDFDLLDFDNDAGSLRYFAPPGCTIEAHQDPIARGNPGRVLTLLGRGDVRDSSTAFPDLDEVNADGVTWDDRISSMQFDTDCNRYYGQAIRVRWDYDGDGIPDVTGNQAPFSAATLDGPTVVDVSAVAHHPTDPTSTGRSGRAQLRVIVENVAPELTEFRLTNGLGGDVPFTLPGLEIAAEAAFTDPGIADTQTSTLSWGDGPEEHSSAFAVFSTASGGRTGVLRQPHVYAAAGSYLVELHVIDDDGGIGRANATIDVLTPADALRAILRKLDERIAATTNPNVLRALERARNDIDGSAQGLGANGALDELATGNLGAAITKLHAAIRNLAEAEAAGAGDLSGLKDLLGLVAEGIAREAYARAVEAERPPSQNRQAALQRIADTIATGHNELERRNYTAALNAFREATTRAESLSL